MFDVGILLLSDSIRRRLLGDISHIPITTYAQAMRVAVKYSMDDVQAAIVRVVELYRNAGGRAAIAKLAFVAEFPDHFDKGTIREIFVRVGSTYYRPSGHDLGPLLAYPNLLALMMQYREESNKPNQNQAVWDEEPQAPPDVRFRFADLEPPSITPEEKWLDEQLKSLGFS